MIDGQEKGRQMMDMKRKNKIEVLEDSELYLSLPSSWSHTVYQKGHTNVDFTYIRPKGILTADCQNYVRNE